MRDRGTGFIISAPLANKMSHTVVQAFKHHYIGKFGVPQIIISDNWSEFIAHLFQEMCENFGIHHKTTTAYNPKAQGAIERVHRSMKAAFRALEDTSLWSDQLPFITLTLNNVTCDTNIFTANQMTFGQAANLPGCFFMPQKSATDATSSITNTFAFL